MPRKKVKSKSIQAKYRQKLNVENTDDIHILEGLEEYDHVVELLEDAAGFPSAHFNVRISSIKYTFSKRMQKLINALISIEEKHGITPGSIYQSEILSNLYSDLMGCNSAA